MIESRELWAMGELDASREHGELYITSLEEKDGEYSEVCYDLLEKLEKFDGQKVSILIKVRE